MKDEHLTILGVVGGALILYYLFVRKAPGNGSVDPNLPSAGITPPPNVPGDSTGYGSDDIGNFFSQVL